ncbi:MAG: DNA topoisomerase I [Parcubacteria group bacterium RIFCSPLOWO2_12_FULL_40_10]|nr:MAG: DNA topoisomerase I [Parcubacteria group bacterium RIFCSPHIGHO2_02_FULL_40_12]OHB24486.1 MAG: DNA topoisomerase I [Parcubacteria group bacterium RIFCSPLOWO2_12_FULL_40_10]
MNLVIVESPAKARTISKFLGHEYSVQASFGHVRDLPRTVLGVDVENNFEPKYVIPPKAKKTIAALKKLLSKSEKIIMATDEDREGEAISWHLVQALGLEDSKRKTVDRIVFHEITKGAIEKALEHPRTIDMNLVDAQQARRVLDRLVGYKLSPFLWKKVARGLSAGRVQSVAVRLIVEREREIENFKAEEYWTIEANLQPATDNRQQFIAFLNKIKGEAIPKPGIKNKVETDKILDDLKGKEFIVSKIESKEEKRVPASPFITSTLQQEGFKKLRFSSKQTMMLAQQLYEGVELGDKGPTGLITYMRTDSTNLSEQALWAAKDAIIEMFGEKYWAGFPRKYKVKSRLAQEAHEAVRPTDPARTPESIRSHLTPQQFKLYDLIWRRFMATQMKEAIFDTMSVEIEAGNYTFGANGQILKFDGFLKVYPIKFSELTLPKLEEKEKVEVSEISPKQHFTKPPPRFNEASLIKTLEKFGIGRPSTYAPIISTIQDRNYVQKDRTRYFHLTEIGKMVNDLLVQHFPNVVDLKFTSKMEDDLDKIADGKEKWTLVLKEFYKPFSENLEKKYKEVSDKTVEETDEICDKCGGKMVIRMGRFGKFMACSNFPKCKNTKNLSNSEN